MRERRGGGQQEGQLVRAGVDPGLRDCLVRQVQRSRSCLQPLTSLFKPSATRGSRFLFLCFAIKRLWSETLSNGVRSILHRPPITITDCGFPSLNLTDDLKMTDFISHFSSLSRPPADVVRKFLKCSLDLQCFHYS